jgi:hypothetical protein
MLRNSNSKLQNKKFFKSFSICKLNLLEMNEKPQPYFCVSGIKNQEQITQIQDIYKEASITGADNSHLPFITSSLKEDISEVLKSCNIAIPLFHYSTNHFGTVAEEIIPILKALPINSLGLELNGGWHAVSEIYKIMSTFKKIKLVMRYDHHCLENKGIAEFAGNIVRYNRNLNCLDDLPYVMIDLPQKEVYGKEDKVPHEFYTRTDERAMNTRIGVTFDLNSENIKERITDFRKSIGLDKVFSLEAKINPENEFAKIREGILRAKEALQ